MNDQTIINLENKLKTIEEQLVVAQDKILVLETELRLLKAQNITTYATVYKVDMKGNLSDNTKKDVSSNGQ